MHVLSVIHYPVYGGPHQRNASIIPVLRERGIEMTVVLPDEPGNACDRLRSQGVRVAKLPLCRIRAVHDPLVHLKFAWQFRADVARLRGLIRACDIDVVLVNGLVNPQSAVASHLEQTAVVWQLLDTFAPMSLRRAMAPIVRSISDVVMATGQAVADEHPGISTFNERLVRFFPAVDTSRFVNTAQLRAEARRRLGLPDDAVVIGTIGNVTLMKGHDLFLRAAATLRRERAETRFVILGSQSPNHANYTARLLHLAQELGLQIGDDVIIRDPGSDVPLLACAFDAFWLTSRPRSEGAPTVIGEAMALQLPVIATRVGAVAEALGDGTAGTSVEPNNPLALATATLPYIDDQDLRRRAGTEGRRRAADLYSREVCVERHATAFELATAHRRARSSRHK